MEAAVNQIQILIQTKGYRYRDVALVCGDLPGYAREITHQFEENNIPLFLDEKRDVSGNPLLRLIKGCLEIIKSGFDYESMFQFLRTGLVTEEKEKTDRLETYVRSMGIRGFKNWDKTWEKPCEGGGRMNLLELNQFREEILAPLKEWKEKAGGRGITIGEMTKALTDLLVTLEAERKLKEKSRWFYDR